MRCPRCGHPDSRVVDSRDAEEGIRRRRECARCGLRYTTYERVQTTALLVVKRDGRREEFNREKVKRGMLIACTKRPVPVDAIDKAVEAIEQDLQRLGRAEVPSSLIGEMVMEHLKRLDRVAYVRFASVYRNFQDVGSFREAVDALEGEQAKPPAGQLPLPLDGKVPRRTKHLR
ncbi:MAG: transcriptional regulator NrdR [Dehalococcoidia bacterium]|nr:transcriptional regulator NrdR [Dehalococcoidia bacterium]MDW8119316.1 transcriptional regulator NrdR [Chloroflexota bacterium]